MKISFLSLLLFLLCVKAEAQQETLRLSHLTLEDGLSQSSGEDFLQDRFGYMWFGTQNGLNKYNGYEFTVYQHNPTDSSTISGSHVSVLYEDADGNLWVGTNGSGLNLFNRDNETFSHYKLQDANPGGSISNNTITAILEDNTGNFWVGTHEGLNLFDRSSNEFIHFNSVDENPNTLSNSDITSLYEDSRGNVWIGTIGGLNLLISDTGTFHRYLHDPSDPYSLSHNHVSAIYEDKRGNLWIGTSGGGLNLFDRDKKVFHSYRHDEDDEHSISGNFILSILEDSRDVLWIGTMNEGLNVFERDEERFYHFKSDLRNPYSLLHNSVYTIYESRDNILWIGAFVGGISFMDRKYPRFEHYKHDPFVQDPLSNNSVLSFLELSSGTFLVGTDGGGLNIFNRQSGQFFPYRHDPDNPETLSSDVILALHEDQQGRIWIGYYDGGVTMYDPATAEVQHHRHDPANPNSLSNDHVFVIYEDTEGTLFFGTNGGGVNRFDPGTGEFAQLADESSRQISAVVRAIHEDLQGNFWIGTYGNGAIILDKNNGTAIAQFMEGTNGLTSNVVMAIHEDRQENLWFGTREGGIHLYNKTTETFTAFSTDEGLPSPAVNRIIEDDNGNLWISTLNGLSKFNPQTRVFENFSVEHGLQSQEFIPLAGYKDEQQYIYFGGINGFNRFHPDSITINTYVPPVELTDFKIFNRPIHIGDNSPLSKHISRTDKIVLPYSASVLSFDYVALNFNEKKGDRFAYMLEGFDNDWNYVGPQRSATYTNLNPGEYTFRVRAANSDGIWNETDTSVALIITPPFWQTTWFYLFMVIFIAGIVTLVYRWRVRSITEQNKLLEKEVARQTSRLFDKNSELEKTLNELKNTRGELIEQAHKAGMADLATNVLHNVGNILNSVNVSTTLIDEIISNSRLKQLKKANELLREHIDDIENFILNNPKGKDLLLYYMKLEEPLELEYLNLKNQNDRLADKISLIVDVVDSQQSYSKAGRILEQVSLEKIVKDTLKLQAGSIDRHGMTILTDFQKTEPIEIEKTKLIHSLVNVLINAKEAMEGLDHSDKKLVIKTWQDKKNVYLAIADSGIGIENKNIDKIFSHGFTTKSNGHGFGLHSCANYIQEIGGEITVKSKGLKKGAEFSFRFPRKSTTAKKVKTPGH